MALVGRAFAAPPPGVGGTAGAYFLVIIRDLDTCVLSISLFLLGVVSASYGCVYMVDRPGLATRLAGQVEARPTREWDPV